MAGAVGERCRQLDDRFELETHRSTVRKSPSPGAVTCVTSGPRPCPVARQAQAGTVAGDVIGSKIEAAAGRFGSEARTPAPVRSSDLRLEAEATVGRDESQAQAAADQLHGATWPGRVTRSRPR